jgi:hypothetical protein
MTERTQSIPAREEVPCWLRGLLGRALDAGRAEQTDALLVGLAGAFSREVMQ